MPENTLRSDRPFAHSVSMICKYLVLLLGGAVILCICFMSIKNMLPYVRGAEVLLFFGTLGAIVLLCVILLRGKTDSWAYFAIILAVAFGLRLYYILAIPTQPVSDFAELLSAAQRSAAGDFSWAAAKEGYFYIWAYQIPFVLYEAAILKLFGSVLAIKMINLVFMVGSCVLIYAIAAPAGRRAALCAMLLYALYPDVIQLSSVLTNQHVASFFLLLGILLICKNGYAAAFFAGTALSLSNLMRPEAVIVVIAAGCMTIWTMAANAGDGKGKKRVACFLILLVVYILMNKGTEAILGTVGIAPNGIGNRTPEWKFVLGMNFNSGGGYSEEYAYILGIEDQAQRWAATAEMIKTTFASCENPIIFFARKWATMWGRTLGAQWSNAGVDVSAGLVNGAFTVGQMQRWLDVANAAIYTFIWLCALCTVPLLYTESSTTKIFRLALTALLGYFIIFLFIEVQERYRYCAVPLGVILTVPLFARAQYVKRKATEKTGEK